MKDKKLDLQTFEFTRHQCSTTTATIQAKNREEADKLFKQMLGLTGRCNKPKIHKTTKLLGFSHSLSGCCLQKTKK